MRKAADGELRIENVFAAPTDVEPSFHAVLEANAATPITASCWRVARIEVWLEITAAQLLVPREFVGNACLDHGSLAGAQAFYAGTVAAMREFLERARPAIAHHSGAFGWTRAPDEGSALAAYNAWLRPRLPELWEVAKVTAGGGPHLPAEAVGVNAARRACPDFLSELRRFRREEDERRDLQGRL